MADDSAAVDYRLVCRTCLTTDAEFYRLGAPLMTDDDADGDGGRMTLMECLRYCTRLDDEEGFPIYICTECSSALQVAYNFIRNALEAHEILRSKLCGAYQCHNGKSSHTSEDGCGAAKKPVRYRCKICGEKVETKRSLKEHVKLHLDIITYSCLLCKYESHKRSQLCDHYRITHGIEPTREQLKPKAKDPASVSNHRSNASGLLNDTADDDGQKDELFAQMEQIHSAQPVKTELLQTLQSTKQQQQQQQQTELRNVPIGSGLEVATILAGGGEDDGGIVNSITNPFEGDLNIANELSIGNEFIVMADGTVEEMGRGVIFEYINAADGNGVVLDNIGQVVDSEEPATTNDVVNMDVDDIIIEENVPEGETEEQQTNFEEELIPQTVIEVPKKINCKICTANFATQEKLKTHMLTHNEIPHFFCDQCPFYTFFKIDLTQHYRSKHKLQPTSKQLQPKNKQKSDDDDDRRGDVKHIYACDLCLYESTIKFELKRHYMDKHQVRANEVQLRPTIDEQSLRCSASASAGSKNFKDIRLVKPDYPNGLNCKKCNKIFYWRNKLYEHYKRHNLQENATSRKQAESSSPLGSVTSSSSQNNFDVKMRNEATAAEVTRSSPTTAYALPSDAVPQIVETDNTIDNDINFDFNGDGLFEDFEEEEEEEEGDVQDIDNDFQSILLTSDDDFEELMSEQNDAQTTVSNNTEPSFCAHCQKNFYSQYRFENHMFVHRGLAPYRCEMCTNLYNTKRALIRHYRAVHKKIPTRDMIQAKGDKVVPDRTPSGHLNIQERETLTMMCAKCPYETTELAKIQTHLNTSHGINDESYILKKLPFECPRCIRSFGSRERLIRHLERSHSKVTIMQQRQPTPTSASASASAPVSASTSTSTSTLSADSSANARCGAKAELNRVSNDASTAPTSSALTSLFSEASPLETPSAAQSSHDPNKKVIVIFKCKVCQLSCDSIDSFNRHSKRKECTMTSTSTTGPIAFECEICHCTYKTLYLLKHHFNRHMERKLRCPQCPKTFITHQELKVHKYIHSGEKPQKCDMCSKSFRYGHHLKRHKDSTHYGKRYYCPVADCGRKFTTQTQLRIHQWNHNGIVPYKCKYCDRVFIKRDLLRQHVRKAHNVTLTEEEIAEIFRNNTGRTNRHDLTVLSNGKMLRRCDVEALTLTGTAIE